MQYSDVIAHRHSIRHFAADALEPGDLRRILEAANRAPSAGNLQAYEIYVATKQEDRDALALAALGQGFVAQAPVVLVFCAHGERSAGKYGPRGVALYAIQDTTIACTFAMLAAEDAGYASVWVGAFDEEAVAEILGAPPAHRPIALLPIGRAAEEPRHTPRRPLDDVVHEV